MTDASQTPTPVTTPEADRLIASHLRTQFVIWAPKADAIILHVDGTEYPLEEVLPEYFAGGPTPTPGQRYGFSIIPDAASAERHGPFPDPRSHRQPDGIHGLSEVYRPSDSPVAATAGRGLPGAVIYELHVGTFSPQGTFAGVIDKLDYLHELGITHLELMPINPFGGRRNWGYDGVDWLAVHEGYGGPDGFKALVEAAHERGLGIILDCVFNHFGPDGNYAGAFGPYTHQAGATDWGDVVNLDGADGAEIRRIICDAVAMWLSDYGVDGIRLDAVHALHDASERHILKDLAQLTSRLQAVTGKPLFLIAESDENDPLTTTSLHCGGRGMQGQWLDDAHHAIHSAISGEQQGYYHDFGSLSTLQKALTRGFVHDGDFSTFRGRAHGGQVDTFAHPGWAFVTYTTTHDQTGNRAAGDRPSMNLTTAQLLTKAALVLGSPFTPMLFQGEEWAARTPFAFFVDHENPELNRLTREGREREFARMDWDTATVPPADAEATFTESILDWSEPALDADPHAGARTAQRSAHPQDHAAVLAAYQQLIALRQSTPALLDPDLRRCAVRIGADDPADPTSRWVRMDRGLTGDEASIAVCANLGEATACVPLDGLPGRTVLFDGTGGAVRITAAGVELPAGACAIIG